jgi:heparan-alpha-glucosaminide N-acetyltransferase
VVPQPLPARPHLLGEQRRLRHAQLHPHARHHDPRPPRRQRPQKRPYAAQQAKLLWLTAAGAISLAAGWVLDVTGVCPSVKRIWTPAWVLFSGGWCFLFLAAFYAVTDMARLRAWAFPLVVIGTNSIAAYLIAHLFDSFIEKAWPRHVDARFFTMAGEAFQPLILGACVLLTYWLLLFWMYRRRIFLKV